MRQVSKLDSKEYVDSEIPSTVIKKKKKRKSKKTVSSVPPERTSTSVRDDFFKEVEFTRDRLKMVSLVQLPFPRRFKETTFELRVDRHGL